MRLKYAATIFHTNRGRNCGRHLTAAFGSRNCGSHLTAAIAAVKWLPQFQLSIGGSYLRPLFITSIAAAISVQNLPPQLVAAIHNSFLRPQVAAIYALIYGRNMRLIILA